MTGRARTLLSRSGYRVVGSGGVRHLRSYRLHRARPVPDAVRITGGGPDGPFNIPLEKVTTPVEFSYAADGWHPYRATLEEYVRDRALPYEQSTLARYYGTYRPSNVQQALLDHITEPVEPLASWPPLLYLFKHIWALHPARVRAILASSDRQKGGRQQFGPQDRSFGETQVARLLAVYDSVRTTGYRPHDYPGEPAMGYFLVRGDDYRFVAFYGNHRLPALRLLDIDEVVAMTDRAHPPVVEEADLERLAREQDHPLSPEVLRLVFDALFTETGTAKATRLGLL